jgi:hypothetical protein
MTLTHDRVIRPDDEYLQHCPIDLDHPLLWESHRAISFLAIPMYASPQNRDAAGKSSI